MSAQRRVRARRVWRPRRLALELAEHEPRTTELVADLATLGAAPWRIRSHVVRVDGRVAGAAVVAKRAFDEWHGSVFLADPDVAAEPLARALDRGPARGVTGWARDVRPICAHADRIVAVMHVPYVVLPPPVVLMGEPDESTRRATFADLDALVALYEGYELFAVPTRWQVRQMLRRVLRHGLVIVAERDHALVGAGLVPACTSQWGVLDALTVLPEQRQAGVAWAIAARAQAMANARGVGAVFNVAATNPMPLDHLASDDAFATALLVRRRRFPGQGRLRQLYGCIGRRRLHDVHLYHEVGDPNPRPGPSVAPSLQNGDSAAGQDPTALSTEV